ncbi:hypothetical protein [Sabulicella rubraurantiaca]|nr:hypothetical protein [Sabulicella rubraurantiaca]
MEIQPRSSALLPGLPLPLRIAIGFGLLSLCLWLPAFVAIFR